MKKLISQKDYQIQPWKNGLGTTAQIDFFKDDSTTPFVWRLSAATVVGDNSFSIFPGYQRILSVWKGQGLWLNDQELKPFQPFSFSGDTLTKCRLTEEEVLDLGIIYDPKKIRAYIRVHNFKKKDFLQTTELDLTADIHYLVAAQGGFVVDQICVSEGSTLRIENPGRIKISPFMELADDDSWPEEFRIFDVLLNKIDSVL